jgi:Na+-transporting NADH:ubiquinone oxidoreductase subunit NqrF
MTWQGLIVLAAAALAALSFGRKLLKSTRNKGRDASSCCGSASCCGARKAKPGPYGAHL